MPRYTPSRPVVVIAYGEPGLEWLVDVRRSLGLDGTWFETDAPLPDGIIQFWVVDVDEQAFGSAMEGIRPITFDATPGELSALLDLGRAAEFQQTFDPFSVDEVLVLERWSTFSTSPAVRHVFHERMDLGRRSGFRSEGHRLLTYDWLCLADAIAPASHMDPDTHSEISRHFSRSLLGDTVLLLDRVNSKGAVVTQAAGNLSLATLARCILRSVLSGHNNFGRWVPERLPEEGEATAVKGIAVTQYRHGGEELTGLAERSLQQRLVRSDIHLDALSGADPPLADAIGQDIRPERAHGRLTELERERISAANLAAGMTRRLRNFPSPWEGLETNADVRRLVAPPLPADTLRSPSPTPPNGTLWDRLIGAVRLFLRRLLRLVDSGEPEHREILRPQDRQTSTSSPREVWRRELDALTRAQDAWERWLAREKLPVPSTSTWTFEGGEYRLTGLPTLSGADQPLAPDVMVAIADRLLRRLRSGDSVSGSSLVDEVVREVAAKPTLLGVSERAVATALADIGRNPQARRWPPMSLHIGRPPKPETVFWYSQERWTEESVLVAIEKEAREADTANLVVIPVLDSPETVRVAISESVPWTSVLSLTPPPDTAP